MTDAPALRLRPAFLDDPDLQSVLAALPEARVVGGAVRDAVARLPVADIDLATPLPPDRVSAALSRAGLRAVPTGLDHGTVTAVAGGRGFEVTTLRRDVETDGRHATVAFTADWREDAARRDFTINALSMTRDGEVFDYFGGLEDLRAGRVRFVGDPATRIAEDYLRLLRFFRFFARYGSGEPDAAAIGAIRAGVPGLARLSGERVWSELKRILAVPDPWPALALMRELGVLDALLSTPPLVGGAGGGGPAHADSAWLHPSPGPCHPDPMLRLAALGPGDLSRLRLSTAEHDRLHAFMAAPSLPDDATAGDIRRALADTPPEILIGRAWLAGRDPSLAARIEAEPVPVFPLQGRDLQAAGVSPGPAMGATLRDLRAWWLEHECRPGRAEILAELARRRAP